MRLVKESVVFEGEPTPEIDILVMLERRARLCYKSEGAIKKGSAKKFIKKRMLEDPLHKGIFEQADVVLKFVVDRGISHEMVRHRPCSYLQESTRYINYSGKDHVEFVIPHWAVFEVGEYSTVDQATSRDFKLYYGKEDYARMSRVHRIWANTCLLEEKAYNELIKEKMPPEDARCVLGNFLKTEIIVKTNMAQWFHMLDVRTAKKAHPDMRRVMLQAKNLLIDTYPNIFGAYYDR